MTEPLPVEAEYGPAMLALSEHQRRFVEAVIRLGKNGIRNGKAAAKAAGYSADSDNYLRKVASDLMHDQRIQSALMEEARRQINAAATVVATPIVVEIAMNEELDAKDRLRACEMLFNRGGMPAMTEHKVTVEHRQPKQMVELASRLAAELGVDPARLIGVNRAAAPVLEGEFVEVKDG
jgi:phage terminase small subunit